MSHHRHYSEQEFEALVGSALDDLPIEFQQALQNVAVVVSDRGEEHMHTGSTLATGREGDRFSGAAGSQTRF